MFDPETINLRNEAQRGKPKPTVSEKLKNKPKSEAHKESMRRAWIKRKAKLNN